jgi:hypothetical protein
MIPAEHAWGVSPGADRIWEQVAGLAPSQVGMRYFLVFQAFMDESVGVDGEFILAGHIATAQAWARFSVEWEKMLTMGVMLPDGTYDFKMSEMAKSSERMERVGGFIRIMEKHAPLSLSQRINTGELARAIDRVHAPGLDLDWGPWANPYVVAYRFLMDAFHKVRTRLDFGLPSGATVDFYFDERSEKKVIRAAWDEYLERREPEVRALYGNEPRFEDDRKFLPLQAADLYAWWVRKWWSDGCPAGSPNFGQWEKKRRGGQEVVLSVDEDGIVRTLADMVRERASNPRQLVYDRRDMSLIPAR